MNQCSNLFYLSTIACKLGECLSEEELAKLSADLVLLGDMLANIIATQIACQKTTKNSPTEDSPIFTVS